MDTQQSLSFEWWKSAVFYHIYPMSFMDAKGSGIGNIAGVRSQLPYLKWLGVDALWISPIYPTPFKDNGYDIQDFCEIDPVFGTLQEFEALVEECHAKHMKLVLDYVPNHTSDQHPWFLESKSNRTNSKRDWYLWADPNPNGGLPNNWISIAGGPGWEFDENTKQYYYHSFLKEQPDLNWRHPDVQKEMLKVMQFWLDKGVDGFRIDLMGYLIKDKLLRNNPPSSAYEGHMSPYYAFKPVFSTHHREIKEIIEKMRALVNQYGEKVLLGEVYLSVNEMIHYHGMEESGAHLPGNYLLIMEEWKAKVIYEKICNYEASLQDEAWPNWVLSNHDYPRIASRIGRDQARVAAFLMLTSRGTPIIYYGDEIGMHDAAIPKDKIKDLAEAKRDPQRTPMQWTAETHAGFTQAEPWLKVCDDYKTINVESQKNDPSSFLHLYRDLIALRKQEPTLIHGLFIPVGLEEDVFAFMRCDPQNGRSFLVVCNLGYKPAVFCIPDYFSIQGKIIYSTHLHRKGESIQQKIKLNSAEALLVQIF